MKKIICIICALAMILSMGVTAFANDGTVTIASVSGTTSSVSFSGTTAGVSAAVVAQVLNGTEILAMQSFVVTDNAFSGSISSLSLTNGLSYTLRIADYDGGTWASQEFTATASSSGTISRSVADASNVTATVSDNKATVTAVNTANTTAGNAFDMDLTGSGKNVTEVSIPAKAITEINNSKANGLDIKLSNAEVSIDETALESIADATNGNSMELSVKTGSEASKGLTTEQSKKIENLKNTIVITATMTLNGKAVTDFGGGAVEITIDYTWDGTGVPCALFVTDDGTVESVPVSYKDGKATITVRHFSDYVIYQNTSSTFVDVKSGAYYYDAVLWAAGSKITEGTDATHFSPDASCTRAQMVTFLWKAAGSPAPTATSTKFTDVKSGSYYEKAVIWAVENNITSGTSATTFGPEDTVTRAQAITFIFNMAKGESSANKKSVFTDVLTSDYFFNAVDWAVNNTITSGTSATSFSPKDPCTRAQVVSFLYRHFIK